MGPSDASSSMRFLASHLASHDVARVIYGAIIGLAVVVALEDHPPSASRIAVTLLGTAVAVGLAEVYSDAVADETRTRRRIRLPMLLALTRGAAGVVVGASFPALFFVLAALGAMSTDLAFTLSKWTGLALIASYGYVGARLSGSERRYALVKAVAVGAIGGLLIGLEAALH